MNSLICVALIAFMLIGDAAKFQTEKIFLNKT